MTDNQLIQIFLPIINNGLIADGFTGVNVVAANQPTQQGINTSATVYFYKMGDHRFGYLDRSDVWDSINSIMVHTETQYYETTFQISTLVIQDPTTPNEYTASDLANEVVAILQSDNTLDILYDNGISILRIEDISNGYFLDDKDNFEAAPIFEFTLVHPQIRTTQGKVVDHVEYDIYRI